MNIDEGQILKLYNKVYDEPVDGMYQKKFGDIYNLLMDYFVENEIDLDKYLNWYTGSDNLISTLTMSTYCVLKTISHHDDKYQIFKSYISNLSTLMNIKYESRDYQSLKDTILGILTPSYQINEVKEEIYQSITHIAPQITQSSYNYYKVQELINVLLNTPTEYHYHNHYINMTTLGLFAFLMVVNNFENKQMLVSKYLKGLVEINVFADELATYDIPNCRSYVEF